MDYDRLFCIKKHWYAVLAVVRKGIFLLLLWFVTTALYRAIKQLDPAALTIQPLWLLCGLSILAGTGLLGACIYKALYRKLGSPISLKEAFTLLTLPSMGKYMPGKVFALAGHAALARSFGVQLPTSSTAILLVTGFGVLTTTLLGLLLMSVLGPVEHLRNLPALELAIPLAILTFVMLHPVVYWRVVNSFLVLLKRPPIEATLTTRAMLVLCLSLAIYNGLFISGLSIAVLGVVQLPLLVVPPAVGANCIATVVGFLAIFAPGGIGVREGVLLALLTPVVGAAHAGLFALLTRITAIVADVAFGTAGWLVLRSLRRRMPPQAESSAERAHSNTSRA